MCHTNQAMELDSGSGRNASSSGVSPLTAGCTASRILSKASIRRSLLVIGTLLFVARAIRLRDCRSCARFSLQHQLPAGPSGPRRVLTQWPGQRSFPLSVGLQDAGRASLGVGPQLTTPTIPGYGLLPSSHTKTDLGKRATGKRSSVGNGSGLNAHRDLRATMDHWERRRPLRAILIAACLVVLGAILAVGGLKVAHKVHWSGSTSSVANASAGYGLDAPTSAALVGNNLYIANEQGNSLSVVNAGSGAHVATISGQSLALDQPTAPALDQPTAVVAVGGDIFVANGAGDSVTEIDTTSRSLVRTISGAQLPVFRSDRFGHRPRPSVRPQLGRAGHCRFRHVGRSAWYRLGRSVWFQCAVGNRRFQWPPMGDEQRVQFRHRD